MLQVSKISGTTIELTALIFWFGTSDLYMNEFHILGYKAAYTVEGQLFFGGTFRLSLQGWRIQHEAGGQFHTGFLFGLFFDTEDGSDMFLRNIGWPSTVHAALYLSS
jgi:hypothetical protein